MIYKAPGILPKHTGVVKYLAPGDETLQEELQAGLTSVGADSEIFANLTVTGKITTKDLEATGEIVADTLIVNSGSDLAGGVNVTGNLQLDDATEILHGTKFRTILVGEQMIRQHWNGSAWIETSKDSE